MLTGQGNTLLGPQGCSVPVCVVLIVGSPSFSPRAASELPPLGLHPTSNLASCFLGLHVPPPDSSASCNLLVSLPPWKGARASSTWTFTHTLAPLGSISSAVPVSSRLQYPFPCLKAETFTWIQACSPLNPGPHHPSSLQGPSSQSSTSGCLNNTWACTSLPACGHLPLLP